LPLLVIDADATRRALPFATLIASLRHAFSEDVRVPRRHVHEIESTDQTAGGTVLLMPAWVPGRHFGVKTVSIFAGNATLGRPALHSTYLLHDALDGRPLALIDGDEITMRRTVAASALAASFLARGDASRLVIVGAGRIASLVAEAMRAIRPIEHVTVWSRRPEASATLAGALRDQGFASDATTDLEAAVRSADIVSCATLATSPLVRGAWLRPGSHLDLIGSFTPAMRESDADCFARSRVFVDTAEALEKSGDVLEAIDAGCFRKDDLQGTLATLCRGEVRGRGDAAEITLFKSVGTALEDLAGAELAYAARRR
jgi:ornithine cyclodeaminase/alanine dehydrogenase-like protein (mu-crystallin family)